MKILVTGAGALGGYFGGRLLGAGRDLTFLVRAGRREQLAHTGLVIQSPFGDLHLADPPTVLAEEIDQIYDLVIVACKAYALDSVASAIAPGVGKDTLILPLLNGMRHIRVLRERFGEDSILGGQCVISASLGDQGQVIHHNDIHQVSYGELKRDERGRMPKIAKALSDAHFSCAASENIMHEMWEKWVFISAAAALTTLMRATVGDIVEAGGTELARGLYAEAIAIGSAQGFAPRKHIVERSLSILTTPGSLFSASMLKDIERGNRTEAEQIIGDLIRADPQSADRAPLLKLALLGLRAYEARLDRLA